MLRTSLPVVSSVSSTIAMPLSKGYPAPSLSSKPNSGKNERTLPSLPHDVLLHIVTHVHDHGAHHTQALALTCRRLASVVRSVGAFGDTALPVHLARRVRRPQARGVQLSTAKGRKELSLCKTGAPGDAFVVFDRCVSGTSAYWRFRIDRFQGNRIDIGVARPEAFRFATVERRSSWSFDCFGRVSLAGERRTYGRQMREGDVVGVLYDAATRTLSFLDNGVCMGMLPVEGVGDAKMHLLPFVYLPYHDGEAVTLLEGNGPLSVSAVRAAGMKWARPAGLPYDGCIIVQTWEPKNWYAIRVDPGDTTLAELWAELEMRHRMARHLFELIHDGVRLPDTDKCTLSDCGITINARTGTSRTDILLSVPHIVS